MSFCQTKASSWNSSFIAVYCRGERNEILKKFAEAINRNHPMLKTEEIPTDWCSWLVYGPDLSEQNIYDNLKAIKEKHLNLNVQFPRKGIKRDITKAYSG